MKALALALIQIERDELIADLANIDAGHALLFCRHAVAAMHRRLDELNGVYEGQLNRPAG